MPDDIRLFHTISRTHSYWGRKPISGLLDIFSGVAKNEIVVDPFCGGGTPALAALLNGARVIASDLNPMAVFLTKTLLRPVEVSSLLSAFETVKSEVAEAIQNRYIIKCPTCETAISASSFIWEGYDESARPVRSRSKCPECRKWVEGELNGSISKRIFAASSETPKHWYPKTKISSTTRQPPVSCHYQLFTGRNLSALADLRAAIDNVQLESNRAALLYVFTGMLYSCSNMQMYSEKNPGSSQGWTALRYYVPKKRMEKNVWQVFENRFRTFMACKRSLNKRLPAIHIADNLADFNAHNCEALIEQRDVSLISEVLSVDVKCVFLDPPYSVDVDYIGFSGFWGGWLKYHRISRDGEIQPVIMKLDDYFRRITEILTDIRKNAAPETDVRLAFGLKAPEAASLLEKAIGDAGYNSVNKDRRSVLYSSINSRIKTGDSSTGKIGKNAEEYLSLQASDNLQLNQYSSEAGAEEGKAVFAEEAKSFLRAMATICKAKGIRANRAIHNLADKAVPTRLRAAFKGLPQSGPGLESILKEDVANQRDYHSMCIDLLSIILAKDNGHFNWFNDSLFSHKYHRRISQNSDLPECCSGAACSAVQNHRTLVFCFDDQNESSRRRVAKEIMDFDANRFETLAILIVGTDELMNQLRAANLAKNWPRGFFTTFDELWRKAFELDKTRTVEICAPLVEKAGKPSISNKNIAIMQAKVVEQVLVGKGKILHYKLRFKVKSLLHNIVPGQFIMISAWKGSSAKSAPLPYKELFKNKDSLSTPESLSSVPEPYLKRPFGIHRAFYCNFKKDYLKHLCLPRSMATILHTVFPNEFDIFYKVLKNGIGTPALSKLHKRDIIEVVGPLGSRNRFNIRDGLNADKIQEIHVVGGGVGMAPLVFFVQALRYFSFDVKAFVGIESFDMLPIKRKKNRNSRSKSLPNETFAASPDDAHIFVDDLMEAGLKDSDIVISSDNPSEVIPRTSKYSTGGFISESYSEYLSTEWKKQETIAITCGPEPMMQAVAKIANEHGIQLFVLMEKRMACGIGVCFSCVCKTRADDGQIRHSRVCLDGPLYPVKEIVW